MSASLHAPGRFCWIDLSAHDAAAAKDFYGRVFGWQATDQPLPGGSAYTTFSLDGKRVGGLSQLPAEMRDAGVPPTWNSYVCVQDVARTVERAAALGGTVVMPAMQVMQHGHMAIVQDPTGAALCLWQPLEHGGADLWGAPNSCCWNELATRDVERARDFYGSLFGWDFTEHPEAMSKYYIVRQGDEMAGGLMEMTAEWGDMPSGWTVYVAVADADATVDRVTAAGGSLLVPPFDISVGRMAVLRDPQGALFDVIRLQMPS